MSGNRVKTKMIHERGCTAKCYYVILNVAFETLGLLSRKLFFDWFSGLSFVSGFSCVSKMLWKNFTLVFSSDSFFNLNF